MTTQPLDSATCEAIATRLNELAQMAHVHNKPSRRGVFRDAVRVVYDMMEQQQPEPTPAAPSAGAMRAVQAIWDDASGQENEEWAAIIDRETGLPRLVAALCNPCNFSQPCGKCEACQKAHAALTEHDYGPKPATTERKTDVEPRTPDGNRPDSDTTRTPSREGTGPGTPPRVHPEFPCSGQ